MCGIAALISPDATPAPMIRAMMAAVRHRGPDDEGVVFFHGHASTPAAYGGPDTSASCYKSALDYLPNGPLPADAGIDGFLALGHRRLSILDLSPTGHQPMCSADGSVWMVYNGEIYNYVELRDELSALGVTFRSQSDTEVILAAYRVWGRDCLARFNGMFAFVLFDRTRRLLFAARDRFGVKPLYYWVSPGGVVALASEIKQFTVLPGWHPRLNGQRAYDFLNWALLDHTRETMFEDVYQLRGGEALELALDASGHPVTAGGAPSVFRWYKPEPRPFAGTFADAAGEFRRLLTDSVRLHLRSDVPVGSCLSGGLDSSSIVCIMNELLRGQDAHGRQKTFSACAAQKPFDEREYIEEVVRSTRTDAHYVYPPIEGLFDSLEQLAWHHDEPFGSTSIYAQWHVFGLAAAANVKVMLDGQGGDELLAGYHNYFSPRFGGLLRRFDWITLWCEIRAARQIHGYSTGWGLKQAFNNVLPEFLRQPLRRLAGKPGTASAWLDMTRLGAAPEDPFLRAEAAKAPSVRAMSHAQLAATALPMLLHWEDRDSMAHSIEARVPFLDHRLVEFVLGLPDEFKIGNGITKRLLREGMRGILPERIRMRMDKLGFVTPEATWVREAAPDGFRRALHNAVGASAGILRDNVHVALDEIISGRRPFDFHVWRWISFGTWMKVYGVQAG